MTYSNLRPRGEQPEDSGLPRNFTTSRDDIPLGDVCPECGIPLDENVDRRKHATMHYGEYPISPNHLNIAARQRRAFLLGEEVPER